MPNEENLIPLNKRAKSEQREIQKMGGKKNGEIRRRKKTMRELGELIRNSEAKVSASTIEVLRQYNMLGDDGSPEYQMVLLAQFANDAVRAGSVKDRAHASRHFAELTGTDPYTVKADADRELKRMQIQLERERLAFEREKWLAEQNFRENLVSELPQIVIRTRGTDDEQNRD